MLNNFGFHIYSLDYELGDDKYTFKTTGGRVFLLCIVIGLLANHCNLTNAGVGGILVTAAGMMAMWNYISIQLAFKKVSCRQNDYISNH